MTDSELDFLDDRIRNAPNEEWRRLWLAESLYAKHDPTAEPSLLALAREAVDPEVISRSYCSLGQHALDGNDTAAATTYFSRAYDVAPESVVIGWRLGTLIKVDEPQRAANLFAAALARVGDDTKGIKYHIAEDLCGVLLSLNDTAGCRRLLADLRAEGDLPPTLQRLWESLP